jgi:hypothetical protein
MRSYCRLLRVEGVQINGKCEDVYFPIMAENPQLEQAASCELHFLWGLLPDMFLFTRGLQSVHGLSYIKKYGGRRMVSSGVLRRVALVRTDVSEEPSASFIRVTRIGELGTTLAATSSRRISSKRASVASYSYRCS